MVQGDLLQSCVHAYEDDETNRASSIEPVMPGRIQSRAGSSHISCYLVCPFLMKLSPSSNIRGYPPPSQGCS